MKKKILISIGTVMVLIVSAIALVACGTSTDLTKFYAKAAESEKITAEFFNNETGELTMRSFVVGVDRYVEYFAADGETIIARHLIMNEDGTEANYVMAAEEGKNIYAGLTDKPFEAEKWVRTEKGRAEAYINVFDMLPYAGFIIDGGECAKCVGKKEIEKRVYEFVKEVPFERKEDGKVVESYTRYFKQIEKDGTLVIDESVFVRLNGKTLELYEKSGDEYKRTSAFKLSAGQIKLPSEAKDLRPKK